MPTTTSSAAVLDYAAPPLGRRGWRAPSTHAVLWLLLAALLLLGSGIGMRDPWPADEPRFALIARDMVDSGQWFLPRRGPELYAEKPPVFLWAQALAYRLTGQLRIAFLLPSLLASLLTLMLVFDLARRLWTQQAAFWATLALLLSVQFTVQGRSGQIDALLLACTTLGLYGLLRHVLFGPAWGWYAIAGAATGLGIITKGTGFLPWLLLLPYAHARWRRWPGLPAIQGGWRWAGGPLAMLAVVGLWVLPLSLLASGDPAVAAYRDELLFRQTITRYASAWHHQQPSWYFLVQVIPLSWLPLAALLPWALPAWLRRLRRRDARLLLLLGWVLLVIGFFSASPGKREMYILPALPAFALAFAPLLPGLLRRPGVQRLLFLVALLIATVIAALAATALLGRPGFAVRIEAMNGVAPWPWLLGVAVAAGLAALLVGPRRGAVAVAALLGLIWLGYGLFGYPSMSDARSGRALMKTVAATLPTDAQLGLLALPEQFLLQAPPGALSFGYKRPLDEQRRAAFAWQTAAPLQRWLLVQDEQLGDCIDPAATIAVGTSNRRALRLVPAAARRADCVFSSMPRAASP